MVIKELVSELCTGRRQESSMGFPLRRKLSWGFNFKEDDEEFICMKTLSSSSAVKAHEEHSERCDELSCSYCDKVFGTSGELQVHQRRYSGDKPYFCSKCGASFSTLPSLLMHRSLHKSRTAFRCKTCKAEFSAVGEYAKHVDKCRVNSVYLCKCTRAFPSLRTFMTHVRLHESNRGVKCSMCPKTYANLKTVIMHEKNRHGKVMMQSWGFSLNLFNQLKG